jgi:hypothetical protein
MLGQPAARKSRQPNLSQWMIRDGGIRGTAGSPTAGILGCSNRFILRLTSIALAMFRCGQNLARDTDQIASYATFNNPHNLLTNIALVLFSVETAPERID